MRLSIFASNKDKKRGISSVVGGLFFLVLMTSGFTVYFFALENQSRMIDTQQVIADMEIKKIQEKFIVSATSDPADNNRLYIQVKNQGHYPIEIANVWLVNMTDTNQPATKYDPSYQDAFIPSGNKGEILENTPLYLKPELYDIKVVSTLGTIRTAELDVVAGGSNVLNAQMVAIPQDVRFGENATITMIVTNTGAFDIDDVTANSLDVNPNQCSNPPNPIFVGPTDLAHSQSTMFFWDCVIDPPTGNIITFTGNAAGQLIGLPVDSNYASDSIIVRDFTSGVEETIVNNELFGKPQLFMTFPNPLGDDENDELLFGVNVANPTEQSIYVSKLVMIAISPRATSSDKIWLDNCHNDSPPPIAVPPTTDKWTCPESNQLMWSDASNPQEIRPKSVFPFNVRVPAGNLGSTLPDAMNVILQPIVFSTLGQFAKAGYGSTMHSSNVALPSVYLSTVPGSTSSANIITSMTGIGTGSNVIFNATFADLDLDTTFGINAGSRLIINIPKEWTYNNIVSYNGFDPPVIQTFPDGSVQIRGSLSTYLDAGARTIKFSLTAPEVTTPKMYIMHILADGTATGQSGPPAFTIGPISEAVLQVCPTGGCP